MLSEGSFFDRCERAIVNFLAPISIRKILVVGLVVRILAACFSHRYYHPDEHFQVLEPAYGLVHGFWMKTWEWERGIRSWVFPGLLAPILLFFKTFGIENPWIVGAGIRILMGSFSLLGIYYSYRLARVYLDELPSKGFAFFTAITPAFIFFGVRTQPESVCSVLGLSALVWILEKKKNRASFLSGLVSGFAYMIRFQSGVFTLALGLVLVIQKRRKEFIQFSLGVLLILGFQGIIDYFTWGNVFHSSIEYVRFNLIEGGAASWFGEKPWHKLFLGIGRIFGFSNLPLIYGYAIYAFVRARKIIWPVFFTVFIFQGFHHLLSHKEDRFLIPVLPELLFLSLYGALFQLKFGSKRKLVQIFFVLFVLGWVGRAVTWNWGYLDPTILRTYRIGQDPNTRGVVMLGSGEHETGGYFYLGRNIPFQVARNKKEISVADFGKTINRFILGNSLDYPFKSDVLFHELGIYSEGLKCERRADFGMNAWACEK